MFNFEVCIHYKVCRWNTESSCYYLLSRYLINELFHISEKIKTQNLEARRTLDEQSRDLVAPSRLKNQTYENDSLSSQVWFCRRLRTTKSRATFSISMIIFKSFNFQRTTRCLSFQCTTVLTSAQNGIFRATKILSKGRCKQPLRKKKPNKIFLMQIFNP